MAQALGRQKAESEAVATEKAVYWNPLGEARRSRIWDTVDQLWTKPLLEDSIHTLYLRKVVYKCSVCAFTSSRTGDVKSHANRVDEQGELHIDAKLEPFDGPNRTRGLHCTGCDNDFLSRAGQGRKHLERVRSEYASHGLVEELAIFRFALSPSEPTVLKRVVVREGTNLVVLTAPEEDEVGPDSAQVVRSIAPPNRKRRRRHKSRRGHGDANADA